MFSELHLFLGVTNKIFDALEAEMVKLKERKYVKMTAYEWARKPPRSIVHEKYFGNKLNGPNCDNLHKYAGELTQFLPNEMKKFGIALSSFGKVKKACFGMVLDDNWEQVLEEFLNSYDALGIGYTPKCHVLAVHVAQFIKATGSSLGKFTEQPFEALHADFKKVWRNYKRVRNNKTYPTQLCACVVAYNSNNL